MAVSSAAAGILIGAVAHVLIGISLVWDKVLLSRPETQNVVSYVFWLGFLSFLGVGVAAFGFRMPPLPLVGIAFLAGVLHLASVYFYYLALKKAEASRALAIMGGFAPVATALVAVPLLARPLGGQSLIGFALMTVGGFVMFFSDRSKLRAIIPLALAFAAIGGLSNVLEKIVFDAVGFTSGYVFFTLGSSAGALSLLARRSWRRKIFQLSRSSSRASRFWYLANRSLSGLGAILVYAAISEVSPAIVDAISGLRYVTIFLGTYALTRLRPQWLREEFSRRAMLAKSVATVLVIAGLVVLAFSSGEPGTGTAN